MIAVALIVAALALMAVLAKNVVRRVFALGALMVLVAIFLLELESPILAVVQLLLYAGGIVVLFGFALGRLGTGGEGGASALSRPALGATVGAAIVWAGWNIRPDVATSSGASSVDVSTAALILQRTSAFEGAGFVVLAATIAALAIIREKT